MGRVSRGESGMMGRKGHLPTMTPSPLHVSAKASSAASWSAPHFAWIAACTCAALEPQMETESAGLGCVLVLLIGRNIRGAGRGT